MLKYPSIDPVAVSIGPVDIHWYSLMYVLGFIAAWSIALKRAQTKYAPIQKEQVEDLILYGAFGVIVGGRCGYVLFYHFDKWLSDPLWLLRVWKAACLFMVV